MELRTAHIKLLEGKTFVGKGDSGHAIVIDQSREHGGADSAVRPKELLLLALGT
jgi:uncharacterized OsmC-like protein